MTFTPYISRVHPALQKKIYKIAPDRRINDNTHVILYLVTFTYKGLPHIFTKSTNKNKIYPIRHIKKEKKKHKKKFTCKIKLKKIKINLSLRHKGKRKKKFQQKGQHKMKKEMK